MQLTVGELKLLRKHYKIDHNSEDDLLKVYYSWAFHEIASAITDELSKCIDWFKGHPLFVHTIYPLTNYYFEDHIAYLDRDLSLVPHMVLSTVHELRSSSEQFLESENDEI